MKRSRARVLKFIQLFRSKHIVFFICGDGMIGWRFTKDE